MNKYKPHGLAKALIDEIIKADMTMHEQQIEGWTWMNQHRPKGAHIPRDIMRGLSRGRYLSINEVEFKFHVKPMPVKTFCRSEEQTSELQSRQNHVFRL